MLHYRNPMKLIKKQFKEISLGDKIMTSGGIRQVLAIQRSPTAAFHPEYRIDLYYQFGCLSAIEDAEVEVEVEVS